MANGIKILFIFLLCIFPLGQIARIDLNGGVALLLNDIAVFVVVAFWFLQKILTKKPFEKRPLTKPIVLFTLAGILSLLVNLGNFSLSQIATSSLYLLRWIVYACLYFVVSDFSKPFQKKILNGLLGAGIVTAVLGFVQYFLYPDLRNLYYAGWDEHLYRLFSTFLDPNFAGGIFVLTFLLGLSLLHNQKRQIVAIFTAIISFIALLLTYSRGSFASFLVGTITLFLLTNRKKLAFVITLVFVTGVFLLPKNLQSEGVKLFRTASIEARFTSTEHALTIFTQHSIFGVGFNTYRYEQERLGFVAPSKAAYNRGIAGTDNSFLFVLATTGIIGFVAYLYLWLKIIKGSFGSPLLLASIAAIFVHALFVNSLFYPWIMEWLWIILVASKVEKLL